MTAGVADFQLNFAGEAIKSQAKPLAASAGTDALRITENPNERVAMNFDDDRRGKSPAELNRPTTVAGVLKETASYDERFGGEFSRPLKPVHYNKQVNSSREHFTSNLVDQLTMGSTTHKMHWHTNSH